MKNFFLPCVLLLGLLTGCTAERPGSDGAPTEGAVRLFLSQESPDTKSNLDDLPSLDDFEVEIYNARALRLYRDTYAQAKEATIKLNAGEFRLVAHHGDTLGAGFDKPYFLAQKEFTVHGFAENGGEPDQVEATARLANVRMKVVQGTNLNTSYKDAYVVVRHAHYTKKQVKFVRNESRYGYIPGGNLYLEVYAQLFTGEWKYYKSEPAEYLPNDNVTFNVDAAGRDGSLSVNITVDRSVETIEVEELIGEKALPAREPYFVFNGDKDGVYTYHCNTGFVKTVSDAILTLSAGASTHIASVVLHTESASVTLPDADLVSVSGADKQSLVNAGLDWMAGSASNLGYVDFSGLVNNMIASGTAASATFTLTLTDGVGQQVNGTFSVNVQPFAATVNIPDGNIWAWKMTGVTATVAGVDQIPADAVLGLQWSADGSSWSAEKAAASVSGNTLRFGDISGLKPATAYRFRVVPMHQTERASVTAGTFTTEAAQQVGNSGFEEYTTLTHDTPYRTMWISGTFHTDWWQLYSNGSNAWWAVNSPVTLRNSETEAPGTKLIPALYNQGCKVYPTVSLVPSNYAYNKVDFGVSVLVSTIAIGDLTTEISTTSSSKHRGEIFLGTANNQYESNWKRNTEGHAFASRPTKLSYWHKFTCRESTPYVMNIKIFAADGTQIASASKNDVTSSVDSWQQVSIPLNYTVLNKKAAKIQLEFLSSQSGSEDIEVIKHGNLTTISSVNSGLALYTGNMLYLDNIELLYE